MLRRYGEHISLKKKNARFGKRCNAFLAPIYPSPPKEKKQKQNTKKHKNKLKKTNKQKKNHTKNPKKNK